MITVTKKFHFCYGHRLPNYNGKCAAFHGHNSEVEVEVGGRDKHSYTTMVIDFSRLKDIVNPIIEKLDHRDITGLEVFGGEPPTAETICQWMAGQIMFSLPEGLFLERLRVSETPDSWAEWKMDQ
jgi:6-pyruvoyltetrahydropterin/6-carboxytetrahydropterin synthase